MAKRIKHVLGSIIDETQSSFIPKRHIANNICLVLDLLDYDELIREESFILFVDYYKAFDSLEHDFILQSLYEFGFGDFFCKMVQTFPQGLMCLEEFVSPYLFLIAAQLLTTFFVE